jgi:hypothetical protein
MPETLTIPRRYRGPESSGNGGYTCGLVARAFGRDAEVTLRRPPPLDRALEVVREEDRLCLMDGELVVAECHEARVDVNARPAPSFAEAEEASRRYPGFARHAYPTCFVCGPDRADGLRIFAGGLDGQDAVAAPWAPDPSLGDEDGRVREELVWAALDCPGAFATGFDARGETLLGRMAARIDERPVVGERHIVLGWPLGEEGRKLYAATALYRDDGALLALSRQTWIVPR